jgi:Calcineurin-like phosphoesterase superfamily domain
MLFNKVAVFGDTHFGRQANSQQANQDNLDFLVWAIDEARTWGADQCIMLGDWYDNRHSIGVQTMHHALKGLELLSQSFSRTWFITGNHDQFHRNQRDITSIEFAKHVANLTIINDPLTIEDVTFLPWLVGDEPKQLVVTGRYVFSHLEIAGFLRNSHSVMPENEHTVVSQQLVGPEYVFSGHFHKRQTKGNILYTGNVFPFDFTDDGDADRGLMLLEWGHEPIFRTWPDQPLYRSIKLSDLINDPAVLRPRMTARITVDIPLEYEEAQQLRDQLVGGYDLRKIEMQHVRDEIDQGDANVEFRTVDQIVLQSLETIESAGMSKQRLVEIYQSLF